MGSSELKVLDFARLIEVLRRRRMVIFVISAIVLALGVVYLLVAPPKYTAVATIVIDTKRPQLQVEQFSETLVDQAAVESQIETIKSEAVALSVIKTLKLINDPEFVGIGANFSAVLSLIGLGSDAGSLSDEGMLRDAVSRFRKNVTATRVGRSYVVDISFTASTPEKAAQIANELAEAYITDQLDARFQSSKRASLWLQQRIEDLRQQANVANIEVQNFKTTNNIIDSTKGKLNSDVELDELATSLAKARGETSQAQAKLDRITSVLKSYNPLQTGLPDEAVTDVLNNQVIVRLRQQFLDDQKQEEDYAIKYGKNHVVTANLRLQMAGTQRAIWDEVKRIAETYKSEMEIARSREESLAKRVTEVFQQSSGTRLSQVKLQELETKANSYRQLYENFLTRYSQSVQQATFPSTEARVITPASDPSNKSSPKLGLTLLASIIAGLGLGVGGAFAAESLDRVVRTRDQLERELSFSCLGVLPREGKPLRRSRLASFVGLVRRRGEEKNFRPLIVFQPNNPFSLSAESLRAIKVAIDLHETSSKTAVIGVVSALPGEGKTTVTASLAALIAQSGKRVLVIDGDLRNSSMSREFASSSQNGISDVLLGRIDLKSAVYNHCEYKFDVLVGANRVRLVDTADMLSAPAMTQLLEAAREDYEYVFVDLPPILALVDVQAAAHKFDGFILVTEWGHTTMDQIKQAVATSPTLSNRMIGIVLNKVDLAAMRRFEGRYGRSYYPYYGQTTIVDGKYLDSRAK